MALNPNVLIYVFALPRGGCAFAVGTMGGLMGLMPQMMDGGVVIPLTDEGCTPMW